jgi:large subunit ribosomal protein L23
MSKSTILMPRLSEKTYKLSESRVYVVDIDPSLNKLSVKSAIEEQFEVKVTSVRIANIKGKKKRVVSITGKRYQNTEGKRNDIKKAYVTLAEGNALPFFAAVEEEEKQEEATQKQIDKAVKKQSAKDDKPKRGIRGRKSEDKEQK